MRPAEAARLHGRERVRWAVASRRWAQPHPRVVVTHNGELTRREELQVATLAGPAGTLIAGVTSAALHGLRGFDVEPVHVVIPHHARAPELPWLVPHRSIVLGSERGLGDPRRTSVERSLIDAACWAPHPRLARAIILAGVQQRLSTPERLAEALEVRGPVSGVGLVAESIRDAAGGIESLPERDFTRLLSSAGLPQPSRQVRVRAAGRRYRLDVVFEPWGVCVEVDGAHHRDQLQSGSDMTSQNDLVVAGRMLLRFSSYQVRHEAQWVGTVIRRALVAAGWR